MALTASQKAQLDQMRAEAGETTLGTIGRHLSDIPGSISRGMQENLSSFAGAPGDLMEMLRSIGVLNEKYLERGAGTRHAGGAGSSPENFGVSPTGSADRIARIRGEENPLPTTDDVFNTVTAHPYDPKTPTGKIISEIMAIAGPRIATKGPEFLDHLMRDVILPYAASKAGGALGEQLGPEEAQLLATGGGMGVRPVVEGGTRKAINYVRGGPALPERATSMQSLVGPDRPLTPEMPNAQNERMRRLRAEGIEVTGGQALGSEAMRRWEAGPYSTKGGAQNETQARQLTRATLERAGIDADTMAPEVVDAAYDAFGQDYETLIRQNNGLPFDGTLQDQLTDIGSQFEAVNGTAKGTPVEKAFNRIIDAATQYGGVVIPPEVFQQIHSEIASAIRSTAQAPHLAPMRQALREMQGALYESIERGGQPEVRAASQGLNNRYRNFKILQKSVSGGGQDVSFGLVSPGKLRAELERRDPTAYARGQGDLNQLARDAQSLTALPTSGTGAQLAASGLGGLVATGLVNAPISAALTARPVRTSIVNRALGMDPDWINPLDMPPLLNQGINGQEMPVPVEPPPIPQEQLMQERHGALEPPVPVEQGNQLAAIAMPLLLGAARQSTRV